MHTLKSLAVIATIILTATLGIIVVMSLLDYIQLIGKTIVAALIVFVSCACVVAVGEAYHWLATRALERKHFSPKLPGVAAIVSNGTMRNLSAEVEEARRPLMLPPREQQLVTVEPVDSNGLTPTQLKDIRELFDDGNSIRTIADSLGIKPHIIQKITQPWRLSPKSAAISEQKP